MKDTARSRVSAALALLAGACFTVRCAGEAAPARHDGPADSKLAHDGQSGSEANGGGGLNYISCPCGFPDWLQGASALLRVTLLTRDEGMLESSAIAKCRPSQRATAWDGPAPLCARLRLRVEEVLRGVVAPEVGGEIEVDSDGFLPCFWHLAGVAVGEQALAAVSWPLGESPACVESTAASCPSPPLPSPQVIHEGGIALLTPWAESIVFAETDQARLTVPASELSLLWGDHEQCVARFGEWAELPGAFAGSPP